MNKFVNAMTNATNFTYTQNGALTHKTTKSALLDMFAMGAAMRNRSDEDVILMFKNAYTENPMYALKCLFYIGDVRGGQGERRFFRTCAKWLASYDKDAMKRNLSHIAEFRRWDDYYTFVGTPLEAEAFAFMKKQFILDVQSKTPSLLAKWLKSENTSSKESRELGAKTRKAFGLTSRQYRKSLSVLRARINVLERLMSENRWDEIEFDKIPSRAGMIYKNAFARHDIERMKKNPTVQSYADFAKDETKTVNAKALYPYECVSEAMKLMRGVSSWYGGNKNVPLDDTNRLMINKYWDNLADYFNEAAFDGMCVVDTSGSMWGSDASAPINVAISLGLYCAEKARGPYHGNFITFSSNPAFVKTEGVDFCDKVSRMSKAEWGGSTNIEAAFDLILDVAVKNHLTQDDLPKNLIIISDMEFNYCVTSNSFRSNIKETFFEIMANKWAAYGYKMPKLTFWNVNAMQSNIPMRDDGNVNYVSGMSPVIFEQVMKGLGAYDLMMDKLNSDRYAPIV